METTTVKAQAVGRYEFTCRDRLFLDTNIWTYIYSPQDPTDKRWVSTYSRAFDSRAFERILSAKSCIYVDVLVISEFINTYARIKWGLFKPHKKRFKDFRNSSDFKPIAKDIADSVKRIMKHCRPLESGFEHLDINNVLDDYVNGASDFNDQVIGKLCNANGLTLLTNDKDFHGQNIPILTANSRLLHRGKAA